MTAPSLLSRPLGALSAGLALLALALAAPPLGAQLQAEHMASMEVVADRTAWEPGSTAELVAVVEIEDHWHVNSNTPSEDFLIPTVLTVGVPDGWPEPSVAYPEHSLQTFGFWESPIAVYDGRILIRALVPIPADAPHGPVPVEISLRYQACDDKQCLPPVSEEARLDLVVGPGGVPTAGDLFGEGAGAAADTAGSGSGSSPNLLLVLGLALLGGLILNVMPCVLPVLSLKVLGLVKSADQGRSHVTLGALATTAGILVSFWALAAAAIVARSAGALVGWGVQFQQPGFVAFLAVVVVLFSLNLWGLFEIPLPQFLARAAGSGSREGLPGHFATGLFATLMATPCSAPFLGTAVGFALVQPAATIVAVFTAIGVGMALPYLLLAVAPGSARFLPRPGAWMATLKTVMGFLLAAAAVWLFYVLAAQVSPERLAAVQLVLLGLALAAWFLGRASTVGGRRLAALGLLAAAVGAIVVATGGAGSSAPRGADPSGAVAWEAFDEARAVELAASGRLVFVDFTADWCLTCKANERLVIETEPVLAAFERHDVLPMKADWTNRDDRITEVLARFGRSAVPFYLLYRPGADPHVFGEVLTRGGLVDVLDKSASGRLARAEP